MKSLLLRVVISGGFLLLLYYLMRDDLPEIASTLSGLDPALALVSAVLFLSTVFVLAKRLQLIFAAEDLSISMRESASLTFVGYFFNNFLPTSVGGDIVKAMCAAKVTGDPVKSVTTVLMDRIFGLFTFILIPSISLLFYLDRIDNPMVPIVVYSFLAFSILFFFVLFHPAAARRFSFVGALIGRYAWGAKLKSIYEGMHAFRHHKMLIAKAMALSLFGQSLSIFVLYLLSHALDARANIIYFYLLVPIVHLVSMLPSLNGLGIREGAYIYFLKPYIGAESAAALGILWLALLLLLSVIGGGIYMVRPDYHIRFGRQGTQKEAGT
ncbi:MAG: hypothetical protein MOGMAGMI_00886 [Candidatus Omnitrophica bacterium]|nr:hypothetical protein [Candidatus Omnitrophota bacterium]